MAKQNKQSRKELLKQDDVFLSTTRESVVWARDHRYALLLGALAVIVVFGGILGFVEYGAHRAKLASDAYFSGMRALQGEIRGEGMGAALGASNLPAFASEEEKLNTAAEHFNKAIAVGGKSKVLAQLALGDVHMQQDKRAEGLEIFRALASSLKPSDPLYFLSVERLAYALEQEGNTDQAMQAWAKLDTQANKFYGDHGLFHQARLSASKGDKERAKDFAQQLRDRFPESLFVMQLDDVPGIASATVVAAGE